ncbi:MAG: hypothetical protein MI700_00865, partial [Balneolales bacterium]|nr:hypothetical protein [Balneolales bacterium]
LFTIYRNIPGSEISNLVVRFTNVGTGEGSYRRVSGTVNGLLYEWVGPGNGDYEPFRQLPAPEEQQMLALNSDFNVTKNISLFGEWAVSSFDKNRFSSLDDQDNNDFSYLAGIRMNELTTGIGEIDISASRRYTGKNFQFFERTREVEFDRKWNIVDNTQAEESISEASISLKPFQDTQIMADYGEVIRTGFESRRQASGLQTNEEGIVTLIYAQDWVQSKDELLGEDGTWFRQKGSISKSIGRFTPSVIFEQEKREQKLAGTNQLRSSSFSFYEVGPMMQFQTSKLKLFAGTVYREEYRPLNNDLEQESISIEQRYGFSFNPSSNFDTENDVSIREKNFTTEFEELGNAQRNGLLIRSVTRYTIDPLSWDGQFFYETNTERRALFQEAYIEVGPELGQYTWEDENGDGVEQIDEFFPELSPNEGTYVLQFLPSDELLPVIDLNVRFRNEFTPLQFIKGQNGFIQYLSQVRLYSRINIQENSRTQELSDIYLIRLKTFRNDSTTTQGRVFWEKELDLFPTYSSGDIRIGFNQNRALSRRTSETQNQYSEFWFVNSSYQIRQGLRLSLNVQNSIDRSASDQLSSRDFDIKSFVVNPSVQTRISQSWESSFSVSYSSKTDRVPTEEVTARILKFSNSNRLFLFRKIQANTVMELRDAEVDGNSSSLGTFELTEGTGSGTHLIWSIMGNYRMSNLVRLSLNYDGRTVQNRADIHTIKLVVSAVF